MTRIVMMWVAGACTAAWLDWRLCAGLWLVAAIASLRRQRHQGPLLAALLGFAWFAMHAGEYVERRALATGEHQLVGTVVDLPESGAEALRFTFVPDPGQGMDGVSLKLSWFDAPAQVDPGDRLALTARLRPARGLANPRQFDFESWAFSAGVHGTGYVRSAERLPHRPGTGGWLDRLRSHISGVIRQAAGNPSAVRLLPALAVADRRFIEDPDWAVFRRTGTNHLLAISGLHIGLAAGLGMGLGGALWRWTSRSISRRGYALAWGLPLAVGYAALAGFSLSTVRALIMFFVLCLFWWCRIGPGFWAGLAWAAAVVILVDPAAPSATGFWLSFGAVAVLAGAFLGRPPVGRLRRVFLAQAAVFLGLMPVTVLMHLEPALAAPLVNLAAIPWVGVVVVPPLLAGIAALAVWPALADGLFGLAGWGVSVLFDGLHGVASLDWGSEWVGAPELPWLLPGLALLALPRGFPARLLVPVFLAAACWPSVQRPSAGEIDLHVLDVGQGLALVVETESHTLLYDTGPRSRSGWNAGSDIVAPFLLQLRRGTVDLVVVSHADADHAGGWPGLMASGIAPRRVLSSGKLEPARTEACLAGQSWEWDGVRFEILHPGPGLPYLGNDSSCVLLIEAGDRRLLLPGDASDMVEKRLLSRLEPLDVLIAGHHGSRSSTSSALVERTRPEWVVFSAGHGNRFGMPHPDVLQRLVGSRKLNTARCGYVHLRIGGNGVELRHAERQSRDRPWHAQDGGSENQYHCAVQP